MNLKRTRSIIKQTLRTLAREGAWNAHGSRGPASSGPINERERLRASLVAMGSPKVVAVAFSWRGVDGWCDGVSESLLASDLFRLERVVRRIEEGFEGPGSAWLHAV